MKAWYINLDQSIDRREHMENVLPELGIDYERMPAVDGRLLNEAEISQHYKRRPGVKELDRGSIGVFLSQRRVWQAIVASGEPHGIVFEDDILFGENAKEILSDFSWLPDNVDLMRFETFGRDTVYDAKPVSSVLGRDIVQLHHVMLGAGAYIVSAQAAEHLLKITEHFSYACDLVIFDPHCEDFCNRLIYQMVPALCIQSAVAKKGGLHSILQEMRKQTFARGPKRLLQKIDREYNKRKLLLIGLLTDKYRRRKTGKISFR